MNKKEFDITERELKDVKEVYQLKLKSSGSSAKKNFTILDLFRYKSLRMMTLIVILVQITVSFAFYAPALLLLSLIHI